MGPSLDGVVEPVYDGNMHGNSCSGLMLVQGNR